MRSTAPAWTKNICMTSLSPPLKVMRSPPSISVSKLIGVFCVKVNVKGPSPHAKVMRPPKTSAASRASSVQLLGSPLPITWSMNGGRVTVGVGVADGVDVAVDVASTQAPWTQTLGNTHAVGPQAGPLLYS